MITRKWFTLVELIVVITILAILWTIAFISFQGYSATARDSVRTWDMWEINSSLELFHLWAWKYPETTDWYVITYTWSEVWEQGKFWETTFKSVTRLDKIPTDPLTWAEYIYSVTNNRQEYQIAWITENWEYTLNNINDSYAAWKTAILKIDGNYNGRLIKLRQPWVTYILAVPSIITSTWATLEDIIRDKMLAYDWFKNLPFNYTWGWYDIIWENQPLTVVNESDYEVFSGSVESFEWDTNLQVQFIQNLQAAYSWTDIETEPSINEVVTLVWWEEFLAQSILNNSVNKNVEIKVSSNTLFSGTLFDRLVNYYNDNGMTISTQTQKNLIIYSWKLYFYIPDWWAWYLWYIDINWNVWQIPDILAYDNWFIEFNWNLYFSWYKEDYWRELMYIDSSNNLHVIDVMIWTWSSSPAYFTIYNNKLYFSWNDWVNWNELMYMDISENINTINISTSGSSYPSNKILYNNRLYFKAENRIRYIDINNNVYILDDSITNVYNYHLYNGKLYLSWNIWSIWEELLNIDLSNNISSIDIYNWINSSEAEGFVNIDNKMYILWTDESWYKQFFINTSEELQYWPMNASLLEY